MRNYRQPPYLEEYFGYDMVDRDHTHFMLSPGLTRVKMRVWPAGRFGDPSVERGYVINPHPHAGRSPQPRLASDRQHARRQMCKSEPSKTAI